MTSDSGTEFIERTIKFQINESRGMKNKTGTVHASPFMIHLQWMKALQDELDGKIEIIGNDNMPIPTIDISTWSDKNHYKKHFDIHKKTDWRDHDENHQKVTFYLVHRIRTNQTIDTIKRLPRAFQILKKHNCYLHEHQWDESEWDCTQLGFIIGIDYRRYEPNRAAEVLTQKILARLPTLSRYRIPQFRLVLSTPTVRHPDRTISTRAYAVEVQAMDGFKMKRVLRDAFRGQKRFVSFKMRHTCLQGFQNAIKLQNLKLTGGKSTTLTPPAMLATNNVAFPTVEDSDNVAPPIVDVVGNEAPLVVVDDDISSITTTSQLDRLRARVAELERENAQWLLQRKLIEHEMRIDAMMERMTLLMPATPPSPPSPLCEETLSRG